MQTSSCVCSAQLKCPKPYCKVTGLGRRGSQSVAGSSSCPVPHLEIELHDALAIDFPNSCSDNLRTFGSSASPMVSRPRHRSFGIIRQCKRNAPGSVGTKLVCPPYAHVTFKTYVSARRRARPCHIDLLLTIHTPESIRALRSHIDVIQCQYGRLNDFV